MLEERPRTDECVDVSADLAANDEGEREIEVPEEPVVFPCTDAAGVTTVVPSVVVDLRYEYYGSSVIRAVDDDGRVLPIALISPTCEQTPSCDAWVSEHLSLEGRDWENREFLVVHPLPTSRAFHLDSIDPDRCPTTYDDVCDEPDRCAPGTDEYDCR